MSEPQVQAESAATHDSIQQADPADLAESALVEEVSIDGMCGVY